MALTNKTSHELAEQLHTLPNGRVVVDFLGSRIPVHAVVLDAGTVVLELDITEMIAEMVSSSRVEQRRTQHQPQQKRPQHDPGE